MLELAKKLHLRVVHTVCLETSFNHSTRNRATFTQTTARTEVRLRESSRDEKCWKGWSRLSWKGQGERTGIRGGTTQGERDRTTSCLQAACNALWLSKKKKSPRGKASLSRHRAWRGGGGEVEEAEDEKSGKKRGLKEKEGASINCPALCGKLRFNSRIQEGAAGKGTWLPAGDARIHAVHDPHAFYMVTTWRRIAPCYVKERSRSRDAGKRPLIIQRPELPFRTFIVVTHQSEKEEILRRKPPRKHKLLFLQEWVDAGLKTDSREFWWCLFTVCQKKFPALILHDIFSTDFILNAVIILII